ncbi:MAG: CBS domain-containing protein [Candidatus Nitrosotenuis sp.]
MTEIVRNVMKKNVISIDSSMTAQDAAKMMDDASIGAIVVLEKGVVAGIITERDITRRIVAKGKPYTVNVKEIMSVQ